MAFLATAFFLRMRSQALSRAPDSPAWNSAQAASAIFLVEFLRVDAQSTTSARSLHLNVVDALCCPCAPWHAHTQRVGSLWLRIDARMPLCTALVGSWDGGVSVRVFRRSLRVLASDRPLANVCASCQRAHAARYLLEREL